MRLGAWYILSSATFRGLFLKSLCSNFEYEALVALSQSGLFDADGTVQAPKPLDYDLETHTMFMTDLGSVDTLSNIFSRSLEAASTSINPKLNFEEVFALASEAGSTLGDFMGQYHCWLALLQQAGIWDRFSQNIVGVKQCIPLHLDMMIQSVERLRLH